MKKLIFGLFAIVFFNYSEVSAHTRFVFGDVDVELTSLDLAFDPGSLTGQSVEVVLESSVAVDTMMILGQLTDKGFVITLFNKLSYMLNTVPSMSMFIRTHSGDVSINQVVIKEIHKVGQHSIAFLEPAYGKDLLKQFADWTLIEIFAPKENRGHNFLRQGMERFD